MIILGSQDNTLPPPDPSCGWRHVGEWRNSSGVAVGAHHVLAAAHTGDHVDATFRLDGVVYAALASRDVGPDLRLIRLDGPALPSWAELYRRADEISKPVMLIGFGCTRGEPVLTGDIQNGWRWGDHGKRSWGTNIVDEARTERVDDIEMQCLRFAMLPERGPTGGSFAAYDSGGGTFIQDGPTWNLAGINTSVDPTYTDPQTNQPFRAAIWNPAGMTPEFPITSIAIRISAYAAAIDAAMREMG